MKKIVIAFIILVLLGGAVFFFGWMNIWVPADSYAVMVSKSSGFDDTVIGPGSGFVWRWQHLLPTNMKLFSFSLAPFTTSVTAKGSFPSADVYAQAVPYHPDFSYDIDFSVSYRLRPKALLGLVKNGKVTPETLKAFYEQKKDGIVSALLDELFGLAGRGDAALLENPFALEKRLMELLRDKENDVEITNIAPRGVTKLPDPAVYSLARANFKALAEEQSRLQLEKLRREQELFGKEDTAFDRSVSQLERYGELFNKYPVLLKYLFITRNPGAASSQVPEIKNLFDAKGTANP